VVYRRFLVGCARATNLTSKVENRIRKSLDHLILTAFRKSLDSANFLAAVCNPILTLASIPALATPEAEDQVQNLTLTLQSTPYP
jgi:hypothetical protein